MTPTQTGLIITAASLSALGWMVWKAWKLPVEGPDYMGWPGHSDYDGDEK